MGDQPLPEPPMTDPDGFLTPPPPALRPTPQHEGFYALLANGEIAGPAEVEAMVASLQSLMPSTSPEEARLHLSQNRWSLQETIQQAFNSPQSPVPLPTPTKLFNQAAAGKLQVDLDSEQHTYLEVDLEHEHNTSAIDTPKPPTTAQPALGDLGAQSTTVLVRVNDPSPISLEQPGSSANTTTTETILGQWAHGVPDVMTDETGKTLASGHALRLLSLQYPLSPVAPLSSPTSSEAATACGAGPPEGAKTPLSALGPQIQELRPHPFEALLRTAPLLVTAKSTSDTTLASKMIEFGDIFTCNTARSLFFAQDLWGPYPTALAEGKPPPEPPPDSTGAAYYARKTLTIMSQTFDERFGQASRGVEDQQPLWTVPATTSFQR